MSAKKAKALRAELRNERFPEMKTGAVFTSKHINAETGKIETVTKNQFVNHIRRIRRSLASTGKSLDVVIAMHKHKHKIAHTYQR